MRLLGNLSAAALAVLLLAAGALYGANFFLRTDGGEIGAAAQKYLPGAQVRFSRARFQLSLDGIALRAEELFIGDGGGNSLRAPHAVFWLRPGGGAAVLDSPEFLMNGAATTPVLLPGGDWTLSAKNAVFRDSSGNTPFALLNARLLLRGNNGEWRGEMEESGGNGEKLRATAEARLENGELRAAVHAELSGWRVPGELPAEIINATVRAELRGDTAEWRGGGKLRAAAGDAEWRGAGAWRGGKLTAVLSAAAATISIGADIPPAAVFARGVLEYESGAWEWRGGLAAASADGKLRARVSARGGAGEEMQIDAAARAENIPAAALRRYAADEEVRAWLAESVNEGMVNYAVLQARAGGSPLRAEITGLTAAFSGGRIVIGEGWPDAENLNGALALRGDDVEIFGAGEIGGAAARNITVRITSADDAVLQLNAQFYRAPLTQYLAAAHALPPVREEIESLRAQADFSGDAQLSVSLSLPLDAPQDADFFARLTLAEGGKIQTPDGLPPLLDVSGTAEIDRAGARATVRGQFSGFALSAFIDNDLIIARGRIGAKTAAAAAGFSDAPVRGEAAFELRRDARQTVFMSDLRGVVVDLPPPLAKAARETALLSVFADGGETRAFLETGGNIFRAALNRNGGADIALNADSKPPPEEGIYVRGNLRNAQNAAQWLALDGGGNAAISLVFFDSELFNIAHATLTVYSPVPQNGGRVVMLDGDGVAGTVHYGRDNIRADLSRLVLQNAEGGSGGNGLGQLTLQAAVADFRLGETALGSLSIRGMPDNGGWKLERALLQNGGNSLAVSGRYDGAQTALSLSLSAPDAPALLAVFGLDNLISEGGAEFTGGLSWPQMPLDFSTAAVRGDIALRAENLRYLKTEQGALGFLAIFSPQSLFQLGFTEIGKEGVQLKTMSGNIALREGGAEFHNIAMENDELNITLEGEADLLTRTLNMRGRVRPGLRLLRAGSAMTTLGVGIAAVQPIPFAAGWFLGKVFEKPLSEIGAYDYTITGAWEDPVYAEEGVTFRAPPAPAP